MAARRQRRRGLPRARCAAGALDTALVRVERRQLHRAGDHHHRHRQQPDHRLPPRRDAVGARDARCRRATDIRIGIIAPDGREAMLQHAAAARRGRHPVRLRPRPGPADVRRRRAARTSSTQASWVARQRLRGADAVRAHRHDARAAVALAPARRGRHARRRGLRGLAAGRTHARARRRRRPRWSTPPAAATRSAARCSTAWSAAGRSSAA